MLISQSGVTLGLVGAGAFTLVLGLVHFAMPWLLDFDGAIPTEGEPLRPLNLLVVTYRTKRTDVRGIAQIMNHHVSLTLVTIGVVELLAGRWLGASFAPYLLGWVGLWWFLRAVTQRNMGSRPGDWLVAGWFTLLGLFHLAVAVRVW